MAEQNEQSAADEKQVALDAEAQRKAEIANHPTNQLRGLQAALQAHRGDVNDRIGIVHQTVAKLIALLLRDAPEPPAPDAPVEDDHE